MSIRIGGGPRSPRQTPQEQGTEKPSAPQTSAAAQTRQAQAPVNPQNVPGGPLQILAKGVSPVKVQTAIAETGAPTPQGLARPAPGAELSVFQEAVAAKIAQENRPVPQGLHKPLN